MLCGEDSWMACLIICVRHVANLYDRGLHYLNMCPVKSGVSCSCISAWRLDAGDSMLWYFHFWF